MCRQHPVKRLVVPGYDFRIDGHRADEGEMSERIHHRHRLSNAILPKNG